MKEKEMNMDQVKIGKFIAEKRKEVNLTQMQLAEKLSVTDRAISKWENGKSLPDASIMEELCSILKITINELFCAKEISMESYKEKYEQNLKELARQKEEADRKLPDGSGQTELARFERVARLQERCLCDKQIRLDGLCPIHP